MDHQQPLGYPDLYRYVILCARDTVEGRSWVVSPDWYPEDILMAATVLATQLASLSALDTGNPVPQAIGRWLADPDYAPLAPLVFAVVADPEFDDPTGGAVDAIVQFHDSGMDATDLAGRAVRFLGAVLADRSRLLGHPLDDYVNACLSST